MVNGSDPLALAQKMNKDLLRDEDVWASNNRGTQEGETNSKGGRRAIAARRWSNCFAPVPKRWRHGRTIGLRVRPRAPNEDHLASDLSRIAVMVEAGGIEPPSEDIQELATTRLSRILELASRPPADGLPKSQPI